MTHQENTLSEITFHHAPAENTKRIWKTFWVLLVITIIELALGLMIYGVPMSHTVVILLKGIIVILSLAKSFYIISIFMHLGDELRNLIMTVGVPCLLFVWFITAFMWDGNSFRNLRNDHDPGKLERTTTPVKAAPAASHEGHVK